MRPRLWHALASCRTSGSGLGVHRVAECEWRTAETDRVPDSPGRMPDSVGLSQRRIARAGAVARYQKCRWVAARILRPRPESITHHETISYSAHTHRRQCGRDGARGRRSGDAPASGDSTRSSRRASILRCPTEGIVPLLNTTVERLNLRSGRTVPAPERVVEGPAPSPRPVDGVAEILLSEN
jgi:hypothetical protein